MSKQINLRPMRFMDVLDITFSLYRRHFILFLTMAAIYFGLDSLREIVFMFLVKGDIPEYEQWLNHLDMFFYNLIFTLACGVMIPAACEVYLGRHITIQKAFQRFIDKFFIYLSCSLIYSILVTIFFIMDDVAFFIMDDVASLFFMLVATYFFFAWIFYGPVVVVEGGISLQPLGRSRSLVRGNWWRVFGAVLGILILMIVIYSILTVMMGLLLVLSGIIPVDSLREVIVFVIGHIFEIDHPMSISSRIMTFFLLGANALTTPLYAISITLLYFDRRIRDEAFDIEFMESQ